MGDRRSRRAFLQTVGASGSVLVGGCSFRTTESEVTGTRGTATDVTPQSGLKPTGDGDGLEGMTVGLEKVGEDFVTPTQFRDPAGGVGQQYVAEQTGTVHTLTADGVCAEPFLDVSDRLVTLGENLPEWAVNEEGGLLGLEFHPNYDDNRTFYVRYSTPTERETPAHVSHIERLSEFRAYSDFRAADPEPERILLEFQMPLPIHQAGAIRFGPDGYLYVAMGDGGTPQGAQNVAENLLGGILRIDVDTRNRPYGIPDDNPLVGRTGRDEFFAWGLRNPWRMSFDGSDLYVADVGSALYEEINLVENGGNYGWPVKEGPACIELENAQGQPIACPDETSSGVRVDSLLDLVIQYPHLATGKWSDLLSSEATSIAVSDSPPCAASTSLEITPRPTRCRAGHCSWPDRLETVAGKWRNLR